MTRPSGPLLTARALRKHYRSGSSAASPALDDVSLAIERGEFVTIMGPSGCGKTTLLNCLSGLDAPDSGTVVLDGSALTALTERERSEIRLRRIGFVFQHPTFLPSLSLLDNIVLPGVLAAMPRRDALARAHRLASVTGIDELADRSVSQLSGGQLQRAAICRALINDPVILFGDEPTGALNQAAAAEVLALLSETHRAGATLVLVTHDVRVAARSERVLVMRDGSVVSEQRLGALPEGALGPSEMNEREERLSGWLLGAGV
ncbi:ABC transporter ATP-binding protein [Leucobacter massiliensis]|uniref:ABC transporter domain-containing protein n=1 Tax=Leucobacter massiliensis TaxID=1686285 RepID=A0A2S9QQ39_9MICO|nr:ABC transporter ATP-binding protein [Leucobacter massiliensis]PRI11710.1 hypothetical protein B4915_04500 [Leucobacter massiliensis]